MKHAQLINHDTSHSVILSNIDIVYEIFEEAGVEGNGYDWEAVIKTYLDRENPELLARFNFDPEGSMFCAYGEDKEALQEVGEVIDLLIENEVILKETIAAVDPDDWD